MFSKFFKTLQKNEKLVLWNRFRIHRNKTDFRRFVLDGYKNPDYVYMEHRGDEYVGKTIYLADEMGSGLMGFFAELGVTLIKLYYADHRGFVPYVSWGDKYLYYEPNGVDGEKNAFLHYFMPVSEIKGIDNASHLVLSDDTHYDWVKAQFNAVSYDVSDEYVDAMADMVRKYIDYNDRTKQYLLEQFQTLVGDKKTIGVHYRGTDFKKAYNNHPVAVRLEQAIEKTRSLLEQNNSYYEQVFLATDDEEAVRAFKDAFGDKLCSYSDVYREDGGDESVAFSTDSREHHKYHLGLEVLRDQYTLTNCDAFICGYSNVSFMTRIMRKAWHPEYFKDYILINNGINHNDNSFSNSKH